jgi:hypothetical protein
MDGIITILIIAAAIIFKVVGKKMDSAPVGEVFPPFPVEPEPKPEPDMEMDKETFPEEVEDDVVVEDPFYNPEPVADELVIEEVEKVLPVTFKQDAPILVEEEIVPKEKIDPKKLIIYSEIMKPKYNE